MLTSPVFFISFTCLMDEQDQRELLDQKSECGESTG